MLYKLEMENRLWLTYEEQKETESLRILTLSPEFCSSCIPPCFKQVWMVFDVNYILVGVRVAAITD